MKLMIISFMLIANFANAGTVEKRFQVLEEQILSVGECSYNGDIPYRAKLIGRSYLVNVEKTGLFKSDETLISNSMKNFTTETIKWRYTTYEEFSACDDIRRLMIQSIKK